MHAVASKRRLINVISLSFVSKLFKNNISLHKYHARFITGKETIQKK
jgi:hypothetical protein